MMLPPNNTDFMLLPGFLQSKFCHDLRCEAEHSELVSEPIYDENGREAFDPAVRITYRALVPLVTLSRLEDKLMELMPYLAAKFNIQLHHCQEPQLLVWRKGGHFVLHQDVAEDMTGADFLTARKVSVVIFLNQPAQMDLSNGFCGGRLIFPTFSDTDTTTEFGPEIKTGLLVAFRSHLVHGVMPVTAGTRYSIVAWFV